jgi:4-amino-4-deoxy-L-arabinose transferase-like glycosyltransferase
MADFMGISLTETLFSKEVIRMRKKTLCIFLIAHCVLWTLVGFSRTNIPLDSAEAIAWGQDWPLGTDKHPPFSAWVADIFYRVVPNPDLSVYLASQVCVTLSFVAFWKLARKFLSEEDAMLSVMFMEGTFYYTMLSVEYNANIVSMAVTAWMLLFFYERRWLGFGLLAGAALLSKYSNAAFFPGLGLYLVLTRKGREEWRKPGVYIAALTALAVFVPHVRWLWKHDFYSFAYISSRMDHGAAFAKWLTHLTHPIEYTAKSLGSTCVTLILFFAAYFRAKPRMKTVFAQADPFIFCAGVMPALSLFVLSAATGLEIMSLWESSFFGMLGIVLFSYFPCRLEEKTIRRSVRAVYVIMALSLMVYAGTSLLATSERSPRFDGRGLSAHVREAFEREYGHSPAYVIGDMWNASNVSVYAPDRPRVFLRGDPRMAPWIDAANVRKSGAVVVSGSTGQYETYRSRYPDITAPEEWTMTLRAVTGHTRERKIYYGFLPPEDI